MSTSHRLHNIIQKRLVSKVGPPRRARALRHRQLRRARRSSRRCRPTSLADYFNYKSCCDEEETTLDSNLSRLLRPYSDRKSLFYPHLSNTTEERQDSRSRTFRCVSFPAGTCTPIAAVKKLLVDRSRSKLELSYREAMASANYSIF
ncbi:hypothetical protein EVAR_21289_1 [Eumeta japonica]|uniref:Uncharacterized protein n=1 Tax=Eumeta variegata TaxID=151549 RepID=A0A4C1WL46_EUMVA|nr:hypothetical protein EVAR_21289_1 [Eumeta japonica]